MEARKFSRQINSVEALSREVARIAALREQVLAGDVDVNRSEFTVRLSTWLDDAHTAQGDGDVVKILQCLTEAKLIKGA
jgi:hypothetical protein